jgi:hypothetical protein
MGLMKKEILSFTVKQPKHRAHKVLFCSNTPFTPKVVQSKKGVYTRKQKHPKFDNNSDF